MKKVVAARYLLWAVPPGEKVSFEVSREVQTPILPECPTSPFCPQERIRRLSGQPDPQRKGLRASVVSFEMNPDFVFRPADCPLAFPSKEACYRSINRKAIQEGTFPEALVKPVANFLKALGYKVFSERVSRLDLEGDRILMAHGPIFHFHDLRCEHGPGGIVLYMIRNPREDERPPECREM